MTALRGVSLVLLGIALAAGTLSDVPISHGTIGFHNYRVLTADLHVHTFPLSAGTLAPWDVILEAGRQGLDVVAMSGHNQVLEGKVAHWLSRLGGPIVLESEEIHGPSYHMVAVGIHRTISWRLAAFQAIDEIHRQGGVAIAAHPAAHSWPAYRAGDAVHKLDGAEVFQPIAFAGENYARELRNFYEDSHAAAIASSDFHGMGPLGLCRTLLFVKEASERGVLEAIRAKRTLAWDGKQAYGDPEFLSFLAEGNNLALTAPPVPDPLHGLLAMVSRICGTVGMLGLALSCRRTMKRDGNPNTF